MKKFMDKNFMLQNKTAQKLYHKYAAKMPIIDYHCHLSPKEICEDKRFKNITEVMLGGDHYKWRLMRSNGISEDYITGDRPDFIKFLAYARTLKYAVGNPLYHWTHLELQRYFGIYDILNEKNAKAIYDKANKIIESENFSAHKLIEKSNVLLICTTDDPADSLEYHIKIKEEGRLKAKVLPTFRPDKAVEIKRETFRPYISLLESAADKKITSLEDLKAVMAERLDFFHEAGCRLSDHALDTVFFREGPDGEAAAAFAKALSGESVNAQEEEVYKTNMLIFFGREYYKRGWAMQLHMGALRNNNERMYKKMGPDTGFDSINDTVVARPLSALLNALERENSLPKTILYTLNPNDNYVLGTMLGNFQSDEVPSKVQFGSGWWFNDQRDGMVEQMKALANLGLLGRFVGMLTDSRSFLSYSRHEYFRRIMCNLIGTLVEDGEYPADFDALAEIVKGISFENAKNYFGFDI